jgi:CAP12/Pycsar effector protein, TIR domain
MRKRVFIIYGRNVLAHKELLRFLSALGIDELPFEEVACELGPSPFVSDIVVQGIAKADAVIALFTPDECAVLYSSDSTAEGDWRWQARPNVIFEAGVAHAIASDRTILVTLGADVDLFSDVAGKHFVRLVGPAGKRTLRNRLATILGPLPAADHWERSEYSGDFVACVPTRWDGSFDEIQILGELLRAVEFEQPAMTLLDVVRAIAIDEPRLKWDHKTSKDFVRRVRDRFGNAVAENAYWWLVVHGFFRFDNIDVWWSGGQPTWEKSCPYALMTGRAVALIERCRCGLA